MRRRHGGLRRVPRPGRSLHRLHRPPHRGGGALTAGPAAAAVAARIAAEGPLRFDRFQEAALYGEGGFFASGGGAGRRGDFLTSPEVGPLFGAVVAAALDTWWDRLDRPCPFVVVDAGAGPGTLARTVLDARPRCAEALRYVLVERSAVLRRRHADGLPLEPAAQAFAAAPPLADDDSAGGASPPAGPVCLSTATLPAEPFVGVVLANELLDNIPVRLCQRIDGRWWELLVVRQGNGFALDEVPVDAPRLDRLMPHAAEGTIVPLQEQAHAWVHHVLGLLHRGALVAIDYGRPTTAELVARPWTDWLRTYRAQGRGAGVLADVGAQDITCEVAFDQLPAPALLTDQATWLRRHGIDALVAEGRAAWQAGAARPGLYELRMRSRVREAEALLQANGLGAFVVAEWHVE